MFTKDSLVLTTSGFRTFLDLYESGNDYYRVLADNRVNKRNTVSVSTGVVKCKDAMIYKITTSRGYSVRCTADQLFPSTVFAEETVMGKAVLMAKDLPAKEIGVGSNIQIFKYAYREKKHAYMPTKEEKVKIKDLIPESRSLTNILFYIMLFPERFIRVNRNKHQRELVLDTVLSAGYFNIDDLNGLRGFARSVSKFIEANELPRLSQLHYFGYKSHTGDTMFNLDFLQDILEEEFGWNIKDIYNIKNFHGFFMAGKTRSAALIRKAVYFTIISKGGSRQTVSMVHDNREFLAMIQLKLLQYGIVSTLYLGRLDSSYGKWRNGHAKGFLRSLRNRGLYLDNPSEYKVWYLQIEREHFDLFYDICDTIQEKASQYREYRFLKLAEDMMDKCVEWNTKAKTGQLVNRRNEEYWDHIVSIEREGVEETYRLVVPESHSLIVDGVVVHD